MKNPNNNPYGALFRPMKINSVTIPNRIVMSPMATWNTPDVSINENLIRYYEERVKGGVGMIIVEAQYISKVDPVFELVCTNAGSPKMYFNWNTLTQRLKGRGTKIFVQLAVGNGRNDFVGNNIASSELDIIGAPGHKTRPMTIEEIHTMVEDTGRAAAAAKDYGFDGIEIHAHTGYLVDTFMSKCFNHRTDMYGGSLENRMRFLDEMIAAARAAVGPDYPIIVRFSLEHKFPGGRQIDEGIEILKHLDKLEVDAFDINNGSYEADDWIFPPQYLGDACNAGNAARAKAVTRKPVLNPGNYTPETAAKAVADGMTDFTVFGRSLIADPELPKKLRYNHPEDVRPCLRCNEFCISRVRTGKKLSCAVNMQVNEEEALRIEKAETPKKIAIIGGGPGGMETARVCALRGHSVTIFEKSDRLGGQALASATAPFKNRLKAFLDYQIHQLDKLGVNVLFNQNMTPESEELAEYDELVIAVGGVPAVPPIKGIDRPNVIEVSDAHLDRKDEIGNHVIIAGGGLSGCECALQLALEGKDVTIVEMADEVAVNDNALNHMCLMRELEAEKIKILTKHRVLSFEENAIRVVDENGVEKSIEGDTFISAFGTRPNNAMLDAFLEVYPFARTVGDCNGVGLVGNAVRAGFMAGFSL